MFRQDPIRRKRAELNLKSRFVAPTKRDVSTVTPSLPVSALPAPEKSEYERKLAGYEASLLFTLLLANSKGAELVELAERNRQKAQQNGDDIYAAFFEGVSAAARDDHSEAIRCFHRAFDLAEASDAPSDGFLYSMVWCLFAEHSLDFEVRKLLKRVRAESDAEESDATNAELLRIMAEEFRKLSSFAPSYEKFRGVHEERIRRVHRLVFRDGKLSKQCPLLLFPRAQKTSAEQGFQHDFEEPNFGNYYFYSNGAGTAIDPDVTFLGEFYRLGGSLGEIRELVFTSPSGGSVAPVIRQFCTFFEMRHRELRDAAKPWFYVSRKIVQEIENEFHDFVDRGIVQRIVGWEGNVTQVLIGSSLAIQNGTVGIQTRSATGQDHRVQLLLPSSGEMNPQPFPFPCNVLIFGIRTIDDLYRAAAQAWQCRPKLVLLDFPKHFLLLKEPLREYLASIPWTPVSGSLVCDWANNRFVDAVKAFDSSDGVGWTEFQDISFGTASGSEDLCYFAKDGAERFAEEGNNVMDFMQSARQRRRGLYFTP